MLYSFWKYRFLKWILIYDLSTDMDTFKWEEPGIGRSVTYMAITAAVFFSILWLIECRYFSKMFSYIFNTSKQTKPTDLTSNAIDSDVINEKIKVNAMTAADLKDNNLVLQNLTKSYGNFKAVKGISIAVRR